VPTTDHSAALTTAFISDLTTLETLVPAWQKLVREAEASRAHGEWFAGPDWLIPWMEAFGDTVSPRVVVMHRGGTLVGVVPLVTCDQRVGSCTPSFRAPVNPHVRRVGALGTEAPDRLYHAVFTALRARDEALCVHLRQLRCGGADDMGVRAATNQLGLLDIVHDEPAGAVIDLTAGWDAWLATLSSKTRRSRTRKWKKLQELGGWEVRVVREVAELPDAWARVRLVESRSWKEERGSSIPRDPGADVLYRGVAERCAHHGALRLFLLEHQGEPVAHAFAVLRGGVAYLLKNSYDEAHRALSPGSVLVWHAIEQAAMEGCHTFDFLGDLMEWKSHLVTHTPQYVSRLVFDPALWGCRAVRFREHTLKPIGRRLGLPRLLRRLRS
jgi:CelD/BcsL family acetyltransferase involved in cellulose biosynthesis